MKKTFFELEDIENLIFQKDIILLPSVTELFELRLAYLEFKMLKRKELINRGAYFESIGNIKTKHFQLCYNSFIENDKNRSQLTNNYFKNGKFSTGYATHGLFPYRGKFHPQLIKAIMNIIGIKKRETILDPMCGSGTTNIEASLMGINSYAADLSPFCKFMTKVKYESLDLDINLLSKITDKTEEFFYFLSTNSYPDMLKKAQLVKKEKIYNLVLLAYLDALGYSKRVKQSSHKQLFKKVLKRYVETVLNFNKKNTSKLGNLKILDNSTATNLKINNGSVDGVITSPPYSFAIDYLKNDKPHLEYFGVNINKLREKMIGLMGRNKKERLENYFIEMDKVCKEISRVLKNGKFLVMIIGSNTKQTGGIKLETSIIASCSKYNLKLKKNIIKPIKGMRNTMKEENILFFRKEI